ncbi:MAG: hypothetical protein NT015_00005, partial [Alphaproteobacteria bacterium]|nr:hypothetical protein [Alphaproteobacteria bacterium]
MLALSDLYPTTVVMLWGIVAFALEIAGRRTARLVVSGANEVRPFYVITSGVIALVWASLGVLLWSGGGENGRVAGMAVFAVMALYSAVFTYFSALILTLLVGAALSGLLICV